MIIKGKLAQDALKQKSIDVLDNKVDDLVSKLESELKLSASLGSPGIGLAAPQIGIFERVAIVRLPDLKVNLVNPIIHHKYDEFHFPNEGCLSFPGIQVDTKRFFEIVVETGPSTDRYTFTATGLLSVACQHEIDHLNGILFTENN